MPNERQITDGPGGRILTNTGVWSPDGAWIVYDTRSDASGELFDGNRIQIINVRTKEIRTVFVSRNGAHCGVATFHPTESKIVFILGPEHPTAEWSYGASRRQGVILNLETNQVASFDACDLVPPFTPGALRGGSHVHVFSPDGCKISFTYEDQFLSRNLHEANGSDVNLRLVGVGVPAGLVRVGRGHTRNRDGTYFCVAVTRLTAHPKPGSDEIKKAFEEGWIGTNSLAFQGHVVAENGATVSELFVVDLPNDLRIPGDGPLQGTESRRPFPPAGTSQRRLTFTSDRKFPGIQGPRHWIRSAPDGSRIAFLMKDDMGRAQVWTIPSRGGTPKQLSRTGTGVESAFSWSPDGTLIGLITGDRVAVVNTDTGTIRYMTESGPASEAPRPEACVFSPDGRSLAYTRRKRIGDREHNQIFVVDV